MKNLTRVLALVLVFSMMVTSVAFAKAFDDVDPTANYADAINVLSDLGILNGDGDGNFRPDADITRAEVTALVNRIQGLSEAANAQMGATPYTDVPADAWYTGDVNLGTQMGMIAGDGNGLFRPTDCIKYEEAVKLFVCAIGYDTKYADKNGGWPTGYLVLASNSGITTGITAATGTNATRGLVARLAYNSLTAPMMAFKSYSDYTGDATYAPQKAKTLLGEKLGLVKITGKVVATPFSSVDVANSSLEDGTVDISFNGAEAKETSVDANYNKYVVGKLDVIDDFDPVNDSNIQNAKVGETDIMNALGSKVDVYLGLNENDEVVVLSYIGNAKKNAEVAIDPALVQATTAAKYASDLTSTAPYLSIYDDEVDTTNKTYNLETEATVIINGQYYKDAKDSADVINGLDSIQGEVKIVDADNNNKYDYIFVTKYLTKVVEEVYGSNKKISFKDGDYIDLTNAIDGKEGYAFTLTKDGAAVEVADLKEYDVLSIAPIFGADLSTVPSNSKNYTILVSDAKVDGSVEAIDPSDASDIKYTFAGEEYSIATGVTVTLANGDEGTIYLDAFGNIAYFDVTTAASKNYGFIVAADTATSFGTTYEVKILDKEGSVNVYTLADKVKVRVGKDQIDANTSTPAIDSFTDKDTYNNYIKVKNTNTDPDDWTLTGSNLANTEAYANRIITFKKNSSNKITEITFAKLDQAGNAKAGLFIYGTTTGNEYNSKTNAFDNNIGVTSDTIVFDLSLDSSATEDDFNVGKISKLVDGNEYAISFLQVDEDTMDAGVVVITNAGGTVGVNDALAIVTKVTETKNNDGEDVVTLTFLQNGETKTITTTADAVSEVAGFAAGTIFEYRKDAKGNLERANAVNVDAIDRTAAITASQSNNGNIRFAAGYITDKGQGRLVIKAKADLFDATVAGDRHTVGSSANVYLIDYTKSKINPVTTEYAEIPTTATRNGKITEADRDSYVLIKYVDGAIKDIVVLKGTNKFGVYDN